MKTWKIITVVGIALVAIALTTASAVAYMGGRGIYTPYGTNPDVTNPQATFGGMMGGMMGRVNNYGYGTTTGQPGWGGCCGRNGYVGTSTTGTPITIDAAISAAKQYLASLGNTDLAIDEIEEYTQNFYVLVKEKSTGIGAFELLIDKYSGRITPEMGPNMMWNTKYGMMNNCMGFVTGTTTASLTVTVEQAKANAQQFLGANYPGTTVGGVDTFYGYYHIDVLQNGQTYGMLSVNGYTGQVWFHTWHGSFIQEVEL